MLYVIRHGQTDWNVEGKTQGSIDIKLNETGKNKIMEELRDTVALPKYTVTEKRDGQKMA